MWVSPLWYIAYKLLYRPTSHVTFNPLRAEVIVGNIYLHFLSFLDLALGQVIFPVPEKDPFIPHTPCEWPGNEPGPRLNIKTVLSAYGDFHVKDKTAVRTSYL